MIRIGLIGAGAIAQLAHLPVLQNLWDKFEIAGITDVSPSFCDEVKKRYGIPRVYKSADEMLGDASVDAVFVLSPDPLHCDFTIKAIEAGKHVLVEKPLAMNSSDIRRMLAAESANPGVVVMVGYMRRFAQPFLKAKELLSQDNRPIKYVRFRDIILEGDFYIGQTRKLIDASGRNDIPNDMPNLSKLQFDQRRVRGGCKPDTAQRVSDASRIRLPHIFSSA